MVKNNWELIETTRGAGLTRLVYELTGTEYSVVSERKTGAKYGNFFIWKGNVRLSVRFTSRHAAFNYAEHKNMKEKRR